MIDSVKLGLKNENHSRSGLTGGDAAKLDRYIKSGKTLSDLTVPNRSEECYCCQRTQC